MFHKILLASDGSPAALVAADAAAALTKRFQADLLLLHVYVPMTQLFPAYALAGMDLDTSVMEKAQEAVIKCTGSVLDRANVHYRVCKEIGSPAAQILRVAEEEPCDLVVLGSRGLGLVPSLLLGSVSNDVTHRAHCSVLIIPFSLSARA